MQEPPWFILGAGAIGCLFAACLKRAGVEVALILHNDAASASWQRQGAVVLCRQGLSQRVVIPATTAEQLSNVVARVLICTKAHQTEAAIAALLPVLAPNAELVLLQNGMGTDALLRSVCPQATILHALTTEGAYLSAPFTSVHAGRGETVVGATEPAQLARATAIAATLNCELPIAAVADIHTRLWRKLAINCVINPLTALHECSNGELLQRPGILATTLELCEQLCTVANASGQSLQALAVADQVVAVMHSTAANQSSMWQDLIRKRRTEIDFISGYVVRQGRLLNLECPAHEALWTAIKDKERRLGCR